MSKPQMITKAKEIRSILANLLLEAGKKISSPGKGLSKAVFETPSELRKFKEVFTAAKAGNPDLLSKYAPHLIGFGALASAGGLGVLGADLLKRRAERV